MTRKKRILQLFPAMILAVILTLLSVSCKTSPVVVTEKVELPPIDWPVFPDPTGQVERLPDGRVVMPLTYWLAITGYVIEAEAGIYTVEAYRGVSEPPP